MIIKNLWVRDMTYMGIGVVLACALWIGRPAAQPAARDAEPTPKLRQRLVKMPQGMAELTMKMPGQCPSRPYLLHPPQSRDRRNLAQEGSLDTLEVLQEAWVLVRKTHRCWFHQNSRRASIEPRGRTRPRTCHRQEQPPKL